MGATRSRLLARDRDIELQIAEYAGAGLVLASTTHRPPNTVSLADAWWRSFPKNEAVGHPGFGGDLRAGYPTTSPTFRTIVNQALIKDERFKRASDRAQGRS